MLYVGVSGVKCIPRYEIWIESADQRHHRPGRRRGRGWYEQDTKLLFTDEVQDRQWLVAIDLSRGTQSVKVSKRELDVPNLLGSDEARFLLVRRFGEIQDKSVEVILQRDQARKYAKDRLGLMLP